ncbi:hypothetical protein C8J57DRAFT_1726337 [Mycena rebaudengoi]|nr:hypothetical protein C8J57DRAFT_1726337 [Mycena rebaudengoi]
MELFGHRIAPLNYSFDPQAQLLAPSLSFPPSRADLSRASHSFDPSHTLPPSDPLFYPDTPVDNVPEPTIDTPAPLPPLHSVFPAVPKDQALRTNQIPPAKAVTPVTDVEISDATDFEILIWVYPAPKKATNRTKGKRAAKAEPTSYGPIAATTNMDFNDFVHAVSSLLGTSQEFLVVSSQQWRWLKPANSAWLPLRDDSNFKSLLRQLVSPPKGVSKAYIIVKMDEPMKASPSVAMPWASQPMEGPSSGPGAYQTTYRAAMGIDEELSDDDADPKKRYLPRTQMFPQLITFQVAFDAELEDQIQSISEKYRPGTCTVHPEIDCFHSRINGLHFALDRSKKIVWAAAIKNGTSTIFGPPLASNHFNAKVAIKNKTAAAANSAVLPTLFDPPTLAPPATPYPYNPYSAYPPPMPYPAYPQFPSYHAPSYYGPSHMLPWEDTPRPSRRQCSWDGSSPPRQSSSKRRREERLPDPPSSPTFSGGSLDGFIADYPDLPAATRSFLVELGFEIGDDLSVVTEAQWKAGGLALFGWNCVLKAYNKYKNSLRR